MAITASNYDKARSLLEKPDLSPDRRQRLEAEIRAYEQKQQMGGASGFAAPTGIAAIEKVETELPQREEPAQPLPSLEESNAFLTGQTQSDALSGARALARQDELALGIDSLDETLPSASKSTKLFRPPEFVPKESSFESAMNAQPFLEPPIEIARAALKNPELQQDSEEYQLFADAMWSEWYDKAVASGKPALRVEYMSTPEWTDKVRKFGHQAGGYVGAVLGGIDRAFAGLPVKAAAGTLAAVPKEMGGGFIGPSAEKLESDIYQLEAANPKTAIAGTIAGSLSPSSVGSRIFSGVSRLAPAGAGVGRQLATGAAGGALAGAGESLSTDIVRGDTEGAGGRALTAAAFGGPGGALGSGLGMLAGKRVKSLREDPTLGPKLAEAERAGMTTRGALPGMSAIREPAALGALRREHRGRHIHDVLTERAAEGISAQALREQGEITGRVGREVADYRGHEGFEPRPVDDLRFRVWKEANRLDPGDVMGRPTLQSATRGKLLDMLLMLTDQKHIGRLRATARKGTSDDEFASAYANPRRFLDDPGPSAQLNAEQLDELVAEFSDLAEQAQKTKGGSGPWERIRDAALAERDKFPPPLGDDRAWRAGGTDIQASRSTLAKRHEDEIEAMQFRQRAAGLPERMVAKPEPLGAASGIPQPKLDFDQAREFLGSVASAGRGPGQEARNAALQHFAGSAGFGEELRMVRASNAFDDLKEASKLRAVVGTSGRLGLFSGSPGTVLALRTDPLWRMMSKRSPGGGTAAPPLISAELRYALARMVGKKVTAPKANPLDPIGEINRAASRGSARQLGPGAAGAGQERRKFRLDELSPEELAILVEAAELTERSRPRRAGGTR